ncbi:unnamed protein product [Didymodactylos carnosus]|uniref:Uncharacterized protein n=1 Tax=Didymodactylos carnosus TaxID=1234261 RepID=A0A815P1F3_9BILA|nr:unnamed protein product [Didymodactylos carnosus]CAF4317192.1 unnamed protein product [Didymodactylos carnosus]
MYIVGKESEDLIEFIDKAFKPKEDQLRKKGIQFDHYGIMYNVQIEIHRNVKDFQIRQMETSLFGAYCLLCCLKPTEWKDIQKIESGFPIERTAKRTLEIYEQMLNESGDIKNLIFHFSELICRNNDVSIRQLSEEALEACNKDVRNYREFLSRKCGDTVNLIDTFNRPFERSDPMIAEIMRIRLAM